MLADLYGFYTVLLYFPWNFSQCNQRPEVVYHGVYFTTVFCLPLPTEIS